MDLGRKKITKEKGVDTKLNPETLSREGGAATDAATW